MNARQWNVILAATLVLVVSVAAIGNSNDLKVKKLVITDEHGLPKITLQVGPEGPFMMFLDEKSVPRISMGVNKPVPNSTDGSFFNLRDSNGSPRIFMGVTDTSETGFPKSFVRLTNFQGAEFWSAKCIQSRDPKQPDSKIFSGPGVEKP